MIIDMAHPEIIQRRRRAVTLSLLVLGAAGLAAALLQMPEDGRSSAAALQERIDRRAAAAIAAPRATDPLAWSVAQAEHGQALKASAEMHGRHPAIAGEAAAAYRRALEVLTWQQRPHLWSLTQLDLGDVLVMRGAGLGDTDALGAAEAAYRAAAEGFRRRGNAVLAEAARDGQDNAARERRRLAAE